jgi:hypothetical protein
MTEEICGFDESSSYILVKSGTALLEIATLPTVARNDRKEKGHSK